MVEKTTCKYCGREFIKKREWQKFCTTKCTNLWHTERRKKALAMLDHVEGDEEEELT